MIYKNSLSDANHSSSEKPQAKAKRMSVSFPADVASLLEELSETQGVSQNEVLRRAIATEAYIYRQVAAGSTILVQKSDGQIHEVVFR